MHKWKGILSNCQNPQNDSLTHGMSTILGRKAKGKRVELPVPWKIKTNIPSWRDAKISATIRDLKGAEVMISTIPFQLANLVLTEHKWNL